MSLYFRRSFSRGPFRLNISKRGISSASVGVPGARLTYGRQGLWATLGIPGTGLYWRSSVIKLLRSVLTIGFIVWGFVTLNIGGWIMAASAIDPLQLWLDVLTSLRELLP